MRQAHRTATVAVTAAALLAAWGPVAAPMGYAATAPADARATATEPTPSSGAEAAKAVALRYAATLLGPVPAGVDVALAVADVLPMAGGRSLVRVTQSVGGLPVEAGEVRVVVAGDGRVLSATGGFGRPGAAPQWPMGAADAGAVARRAAADRAGLGLARLRVLDAAPVVADTALLAAAGAPQDPAAPGVRGAWAVEVAGPDDVPRARARLVIDATSGAVLAVQPRTRALDRVVCDGRNLRRSLSAGVCRAVVAARREGAGPVGLGEVDSAYDILGRTSEFFDTLGVDLTRMIGYDFGDGQGRQLRATVRYCPPPDVDECPMVNAFWLDDGSTDPYRGGVMFIGAGLVADDVIAHELTHGVTAATAALAYSGEPGALNESMSDVFGELVDQATLESSENPGVEARWSVGESLPGGAVRSISDPPGGGSAVRQPDRMGSKLWWTRSGDDGGVHVNSGVGNKTAYLIAVGGEFRGSRISGIGAAKTAALYWDVLPRLTPGAGYADLGGALRQACRELDTAGIAEIAPADCDSVDAAVAATQLTERRIVIEVDEPAVDAGSRTRVLAEVTDAVRVGTLRPHRRAEVTLQARTAADADWVGVATKPVNASGRARFGVRPQATTRYRIVSVASGPWTAADSPEVVVAVSPRLVLSAPAAPVVAGTPTVVPVSMPVPPAADLGGRVLLQQQSRSGSWSTVARALVDAAGSAAVAWVPGEAGTVSLRAVRPADAAYAKATSPSIEVTVVEPATVTPAPVPTPDPGSTPAPTPAPATEPAPVPPAD